SCVAEKLLSILHNTLNYSPGEIAKIPTIYKPSENTLSLANSCLFISKSDWDSRETSWDFEKSPLLNSSSSLPLAYETWEENVTNDFFQLHANEEELNRIFIEIYGLEDELTPDVPLKDITILQEELDKKVLEALEPTFRAKGKEAVSLPINKAEMISQFISYAIGVFLGRYRLDKPGLNIAHPNPSDEELENYIFNGQEIAIDDDGILPLMGEDCAFPDDILVRTKEFIQAIWGEDSLTENINFIHDALGMDLHKWLVEKFWNYHTSMYKKKPIYWLFSSNVNKPQNAAFKVLVYMHRMDKYTVQKIQRNYLYPHQEHIKREIEK
ncbi:SAM-dependent methyltransferase, partial [Myroides odoratimimus]|nr:SAM-dependent methyltransferase [Myroides odoratimimus]